ncbi:MULTISPECIES: hypothetical protein [Borreliella]|nr:hypothetical protein [Borreliella valaisiana]WLN25876.1 hypothetical protein KJD10_05625 [Borreliella valaisiana]WLN25906.1 hypothetical protein KJD10_05810 [Borreliella valaisiana]
MDKAILNLFFRAYCEHGKEIKEFKKKNLKDREKLKNELETFDKILKEK